MKWIGIFLIITILIVVNESTTVTFNNYYSKPVYLTFTGQASWGSTCSPPFNTGVTCVAEIGAVGSTRFCGALDGPQNCDAAQQLQLTLIETNFVSGGVWVDISVIPPACTPQLWDQNQCSDAGGASYNIPVEVSCNDASSFICQGPPSGPAGYPSNCGTSNGDCIGSAEGNPALCNQAYFFPTPTLEPVYYCNYINITFLSTEIKTTQTNTPKKTNTPKQTNTPKKIKTNTPKQTNTPRKTKTNTPRKTKTNKHKKNKNK